MTEKTMHFVHTVRIGIYVAAVAALLLKAIILLPPINADEEEPPKYDLFWPPDMVPHPMPPVQEEEKEKIA